MSGFLGQILQGVMGSQQGQPSAAATILQQVLSVRDGDKQGIPALISKFQSAGLGQVVESWIGTGANQSVSNSQIGQVFSQQQVDGWAQQSGTTPDAVRNILAEALPHVVDHATPNGEVPAQTPDWTSIAGRLLQSFGNRA